VIADDSGLSVAALGGEPGVSSSRFGAKDNGPLLSDEEKNRLLLAKMQGVENRRAVFVCCMVLILDELRFLAAQEVLEGSVALEPAGSGGFGYDPIFLLPDVDVTVAQVTEAAKDRISHRGKAARRILAAIGEGPDQSGWERLG
jgi:XTP/dITP diphosphohydrolase